MIIIKSEETNKVAVSEKEKKIHVLFKRETKKKKFEQILVVLKPARAKELIRLLGVALWKNKKGEKNED